MNGYVRQSLKEIGIEISFEPVELEVLSTQWR